jgi:hypothetical protein
LAEVQVDDPALELAFTQVRREDFLGSGPWVIPRLIGGYLPTWLTIPPTQQAEPCFGSNGERPNFQFSV